MSYDKLLKLIKKYSPNYTMQELRTLKTNNVFMSVMDNIPLNPKSRKDADTMQRLYYDIN